MANSIDRVKQQIRERLEEIDAERDQLTKALEALSGGSGASVGARRGRPPGSGSKRGGSGAGKRAAGKRAPRGQRRQQVIDVLQGRELGPSAIAREIGDVNPTQISGLLRQLAGEGVVARTDDGKWQLAGAGASTQAASNESNESPPREVSANGAAQDAPSQEDSVPGY